MVKAFVTGFPIRHSRSPIIHGYWLKQHGIDGSYQAIEVAPEGFADFLASLEPNGYIGGNVTLPHKERAFDLCEKRDGAAEEIGAVNTLWFENGQLVGGNTDAFGFLANLDASQPGWDKRESALILGAGGACRAVIYGLKQRGFSEIHVANRTLSRAQELADRFGPTVTPHEWAAVSELLGQADMIVNTTSLGMEGKEAFTLDISPARKDALVTDVVYIPLETPFLRAARAHGLATVDGLGMLLHQAVFGFEHWFGIRPVVTDELRNIVLADMANSGSRPK
ncbi:shikimate dehydrogenase [Phyllobacterium sp. 21LDTY02-6]|uniref:shikimate dehydrogenase n=1 Tax=Phyllobacterium sp. 21LDTY02-6 TaxID=2944903 RepID=UPI0020218961|nr:shikimate dehydrogenase [Phyllobacterium sp. 21LDTY02-6]MCO4317307.1 shikimate dehydrogenase [Phyllobacterium sp. 21LDTY02-6]